MRLRKKPGMSRVLIGSISSFTPRSRGRLGGEGEVVEQRRLEPQPVGVRRRDPGEAVEALAAERFGGVERAGEPVAEGRHPVGQDRQAALARVPVACRAG